VTIAGSWRYGDWRHVATGCTALVLCNECRTVKSKTGQLEKTYRRLRPDDALEGWKKQFALQRASFQMKRDAFWATTINSHETNPRALWHVKQLVSE